MDASHKGPTLAYLKKVADATKDSGVGNGWYAVFGHNGYSPLIVYRFKIQNEGFANGVWGTEKVIQNSGKQVIHIPDCIANCQYLLRPEMIALHGARTAGGAQLYVGTLTRG